MSTITSKIPTQIISFMKDYLKWKRNFSDGSFIVADGAYSGEENSRLASEHNLKLVTTNFTGRKPDEIYADFVFTDDGKYLIKCKNNRVPEDCIYDPGNERSVAYFRISDCEGCPYKERCQSRFLKHESERKYLGNPLVVQNNYSTCRRKNFLNMQNLEME